MIFKNLVPLLALGALGVTGQTIKEDGMVVRAVIKTDPQAASSCNTKEVDLIDKALAADIFEALMTGGAAVAPNDQEHRALDDGFFYCPEYCKPYTSFWCYVFTRGYCTDGVNGISPTGGWADILGWYRRHLAEEEPAPEVRALAVIEEEDQDHRALDDGFFYCPEYCKPYTSFWCYVFTRGYCTDGVNGISPTGGWADILGWYRRHLTEEAPKVRALAVIEEEDQDHRALDDGFFYCPEYCKPYTSFWCYVFTRGYCTDGVNGISPTGGWADILGWYRRHLKAEVDAAADDDSHKVRFLDAGEIQSMDAVGEAHTLAVQSLTAQDAISVECVSGLDMTDFMFIEFEA